jgi:hypothetical protein
MAQETGGKRSEVLPNLVPGREQVSGIGYSRTEADTKWRESATIDNNHRFFAFGTTIGIQNCTKIIREKGYFVLQGIISNHIFVQAQ